MIFGNLAYSQSYENLLGHPIWKKAFDALRQLTPDSPLGKTQLHGSNMYINVHTYDTLETDQCRFESHRHAIDIQYTISGGELIQWAPGWEMQPDGSYNSDLDFQHYLAPPDKLISLIRMPPGNFVLFYPCDAHRPKINDRQNTNVLKAVVKIDTSLIS